MFMCRNKKKTSSFHLKKSLIWSYAHSVLIHSILRKMTISHSLEYIANMDGWLYGKNLLYFQQAGEEGFLFLHCHLLFPSLLPVFLIV